MPTTGPFSGKLLGLYIGNTLQAYSTSLSMTINGTVIDITTKDSSLWSGILMGTKSATVTLNGLVALDSTANADKLGDYLLATGGTSATVKIKTGVSGDKYWYFTAHVTSLTVDSPNDAPVTYSATMQSTGQIYSVQAT